MHVRREMLLLLQRAARVRKGRPAESGRQAVGVCGMCCACWLPQAS